MDVDCEEINADLSRKRNFSDQTEVASSTPISSSSKSKLHTSAVWEHYDKVRDDDGKLIQSFCKYCKHKYGAGSSTSTLTNHLAKCSKYPYNELVKKQKTLEFMKQEGGEALKLVPWKFDEKKARRALGEMIIEDELPFSFVQRKGFIKFVETLQPRFSLVCRNTIAKDCMNIYNELKRDLKNGLFKNASRLCLTTDIWTSVQNLSYMVITAHFIDSNWDLHKRILIFMVVSSHKGTAIASAIEACMLDWGIDKLFTITVDNASANDAAIAILKKKLIRKNALVLEGEFFHMKCTAHILNLIVKDGIAEIEKSISRIRQAVRYIRSSPQRAHYFNEFCEIEKVSSKRKLVLDVPTRWNYTYLMLKTALKFKNVFDVMEMERPFAHELPDGSPLESDWSRASTLCKFLEQFYNITTRLSGSKYVTSNSYFHDVFMIQQSLIDWALDAEDDDLREMAKSMQKKFDKYWGDVSKINMMLLLAVVLDPCFKLKYVKFCYATIYDSVKVSEVERHIRDSLFRMYSAYELMNKNGKTKMGGTVVDIEVDQVVNPVVDNGEVAKAQMRKAYLQSLEEENNGAKSEIERFLDEAVEKEEKDFDILRWWKINSQRFPILSLIAKDILAIPVTTVASESAFSTGGRVLDAFRSSMTPKIVESLICAQDWLRASPLPIDIDLDISDVESTLTECSDLVGPSTLRE